MSFLRGQSFWLDTMGSTSFILMEEGLTIWVSFNYSHCQIFASLSLLMNLARTKHNRTLKSKSWIFVSSDCWHHLVINLLDSLSKEPATYLKGLTPTHLRMTTLAKSISKPIPQWTIEPILPANQPAFRFPSKHLSHLWLDPCCLDTVHAVVIGPYPNQ